MSTSSNDMANWGIDFISKVDTKLQEPGHDELLEFWRDGDFDAAFDGLTKLYPDVSEEQWQWVEEFLSEI